MTLNFATVSLTDDTLSVQFSYEPRKYDLKTLLVHWWFPSVLLSCVIDSAVFWFKTPIPAEVVCAGITFLCATVLYQIIRSSFYVATYTFNRTSDSVSRNGTLVAQLSEADIVLQTRLGSSGNRRFRLILKRKGQPSLVLTETPLLEDGIKIHQYYGQTHAENIQTTFSGWIIDTGRRDSVDERDVNIFALAKMLAKFVNTKPGIKAPTQAPAPACPS